MPPRLNFLASCRALAVRPRRPAATPSWLAARALAVTPTRGFADGGAPIERPRQPPTSPAAESAASPLPSSPPPAADSDSKTVYLDNALDGEGDVSLASLKAGESLEDVREEAGPTMDNEEALRQLEMISYGVNAFDTAEVGHKYGIPEIPIPDGMHLKHRYHPVLEQVTNLLMRDGKKSKAQREMAMVLNFLRTFPAPRINPARPLLPGAPPPSHLPLDPITYLTLAIDSVAPLIKIRMFSGLAGGGASSPVPFPLELRQRRRTAFKWLLDTVNKKPSKGSGRTQLAHRIAEEIVAIVEGRSSLWEKRMLVHKLGTTARANIVTVMKKR